MADRQSLDGRRQLLTVHSYVTELVDDSRMKNDER
jgi:hypothetical protein